MKLIFVRKQHEVGEIWSYFFSFDEMPEWQAGQYLNLSMPDVPPVFADRILTIASAPHEKLLQFTTLLTPSPFKQKLDSLKEGDEVQADQLGGDFTWGAVPSILSSDGAIERLFIAGGIGVTPYISIIRDRLYKKQPINATLLYAGKDEKRPFMAELEKVAQQDVGLKLKIYSDTRLTLSQLQKDIPNIEDFIVYLAGSQKFSEALGEGIVSNGFPRSQIKYDYFDGYVDIEY